MLSRNILGIVVEWPVGDYVTVFGVCVFAGGRVWTGYPFIHSAAAGGGDSAQRALAW